MKQKLHFLFSVMLLLLTSFSVRAQEDVTSQYLQNADLSVENTGWTYFSDAYKYGAWRLSGEGVTAAVEFYAGWGSLEHTDFKFSQTVTLPAGDYRIAVNAFYREGNSGDGTNANKAWIFAGATKQNVVALKSMADVSKYDAGGDDMNDAMHAFAQGAFSNAFDFTVESEQAIEIGFQGRFDAIRQWCILGPVKLYKYSLEDYLTDYRAKVAEANAIEGKMGAAEEQALKDAIVPESSFSLGSQVSQAIAKLKEAINAAQTSIDKYAALTEALKNGSAIKDNVSDADAVAAYEAAVAEVESAYDAGTVSDFAAASKTVNDAAVALVKKQDADGSDYTLAIVNPQCNGENNAVAGWTADFPVGGNGPMKPSADAIEYWAGSADPRAEAQFDIWQEITGLPNGIYTVSADMYNSLNGEGGDYTVFSPTCGLYAASGDAEEIALVDAEGDQLKPYTTGEVEVTNGKLRIGVKSVSPLAARWFVADNFKLTLVRATGGEPEPEKTPYDLALEAIQSGTSYRIFTEVDGTKYFLSSTGYLVDKAKEAMSFTFNAVTADGTLYPTGWNLGCQFTNPSLSSGSTGDVVQTGHINVSTGNNRNDWERQVFFLNEDGMYAIRATNANSANWGANTYWAVVTGEDGLPDAGYALTESYVWQIEEFVDPRPEAFAKVQTWAAKLQKAEGLVQDASMYISNAKDPAEGSYAALLDGDYNSFFHSTWHTSADPGEDHYLQAELTEPVQDFYIYFKKRSQNNNNRPTQIDVAGSNDGESFAAATSITEGLPTGATPIDFISQKITLSEASKFVRFTVPTTNNGAKTGDHVFFTFSEFYILPVDETIEAAAPYLGLASYADLDEADIPTIEDIDAQIAALAEKAEAQKAGANLNELIDRILAIIEDKDGYTDNEGVVDPVSAALGSIRGLEYETTEEVAGQREEVLNQARTFFAGITPKKDIDVTEFYLVNPTPTSNLDGWEGDAPNAFDPANNNAEYWNQSAYSFHQTTSLPAGDYKLSVVAVTRDGMTAKFSANDAETDIVTMPNQGTEAGVDYLDRREHCNTWFNAGNGVNTVELSLEEEGDVTLSLTADSDNGDHWLVWRGFSIILVAPEIVEPTGLDLTVDKGAYKESSNNFVNLWTSTTDPVVTVTASANNMDKRVVEGNFQWYSGSAKTGTYTMTVPVGYKINSYTITAKANSDDQTIAAGEQTSTFTSAESADFTVEGVDAQSATFTLSGSNTSLLISNIHVDFEAVPTADIVFNVKDAEGKVLASETKTINVGTEVGKFPTTLLRPFVTYEYGEAPVASEAKTYNFDAVATSVDTEGTFNIKNGANFLYAYEGSVAYGALDADQAEEDYALWTITGNPYETIQLTNVANGVVIAQDAAGWASVSADGTPMEIVTAGTTDAFTMTNTAGWGFYPYQNYFYVAEGYPSGTFSAKKVELDVETPYTRALAAIKDGTHYRVFTEVDGQKYYLTNAGTLTANAEEAPSFNFRKVAGVEYNFGFMLQSSEDSYFSNPAGTNEAALTQGHLNATTTNKRNDWEAQVFFLNEEGLYAVRSTNAAYAESSWGWVGSAYWTVNQSENGPLAEYSFDQNFIWQLEVDESYIEMALNLIYNGEKIATKSATFQVGEAPVAPAEFNNGLVTLTADVEAVAEDTKEINFTAEWNGLFEFSENFADAKWYNMNIRSNYWVAMDETEPYYPKADKDLVAPESMWAFIGNPFNLTIINRAAGEGQSLTKDGSNVVMREGEYAWELFGNSDGFVLRAPGTANDWVNQNGGASGPLQFWVSANGKTDNGSTFRVSEAEEIGLVKLYKFNQEEVPVVDWEPLTAFDASVINEAAELLGAAPADLIFQLVDSTGVRTDYNGNPDEILFWVDYDGNKSNWGVNNKYYIMYNAETPEISIIQFGAEKNAILNAVVRLANADGKYVEFRIKETMEPMVYVFLKDFAAVADPIQLTIQAAGEGLGEDASDALDLDAIKAAVGENYVVYGKGVAIDGEQTINTDYSCDPHPGFWCLQDGTASTWFDEASTFGISFFTDEAVFKAWSKAAWTEAATAYFYFVNEETKQYQAVEIQLLPGEGVGGTEYAGIINQTQTHPDVGVVGETTGEQTVTITPVDDEHVNITYSGFDLPMAALGSFGEFTIENVTVTKNEDGSISYSAESFVVNSVRGQMTMPYNGTLEGTQASEEATPVLKLVLKNATTDTVWFGADQAAIDAVGIRGINADEIEGTIYDLGGRKVSKIQRGGIYVINGKKVAVK